MLYFLFKDTRFKVKTYDRDMESQGNSLFSEVEDQRAKTASELRILEETYRSKIHRFDDLEKELEQKRSENNELHFKGKHVNYIVSVAYVCKD